MTKREKKRTWAAITGAACLVVAMADLQSQAANPALPQRPSASSRPEQLATVIVTAEKRPENVQTVPMAVSVVSDVKLQDLNAQTFADYFRTVPGLMVNLSRDGTFDFSLRGVSNADNNPSVNGSLTIATVSQYYDEIPVTSNGFQLDPRLVDIDHIEILRGPQGTLYGEGALGGTIRIITKKPDPQEFAASAETRVSDTQHGGLNHSESAMLNAPLADGKAAVRLNAFYADDSGYIDAVAASRTGQATGVVDKKGINPDDASGFRGMLLVRPSSDFSLLGEAVHSDSHNHVLNGYEPSVGDLDLPVCPAGSVITNCIQPTFVGTVSKGDLYNLTAKQKLGWASVVSSSSYVKSRVEITNSECNTNGCTGGQTYLTAPFQFQETSAFTQELRLQSSPAWAQNLRYVVGGFYQDKTVHINQPLPTLPSFSPMPSLSGQNYTTFTTRQAAIFGQADYRITRAVRVQLGARGESIRNSALDYQPCSTSASIPASQEQCPGGVAPPPAPPFPQPPTYSLTIDTHTHYTPVTGKGAVQYFLSDNAMTYFSVAQGFRDGGINETQSDYDIRTDPPTLNPPGTNQPYVPPTYRPDTDTTYELGWKLSFPAVRGMLDGAVYHTVWRDMQVLAFANNAAASLTGLAPAWENAPAAAIDGLEMEGGLQLFPGLNLSGSLSLMDPRLTKDFQLSVVGQGNPSQLRGRSGDALPFVARVSGSLSLNYRHRLGVRSLEWFAVFNQQYVGKETTDFDPADNTQTPANPGGLYTYFVMQPYWQSSAQIGISNAQWRAALFVNNLTNARPDLGEFNIGNPGTPIIDRMTDRPRTVGLDVRYMLP